MKNSRDIRTDPANDNYGRHNDLPPGFSGEKNEVLKKSTRKENPAPAPPDETDDGGYWESLLSS